jgi:hypothetical protein
MKVCGQMESAGFEVAASGASFQARGIEALPEHTNRFPERFDVRSQISALAEAMIGRLRRFDWGFATEH